MKMNGNKPIMLIAVLRSLPRSEDFAEK
jgi:hypothetical protein